MHTPRLSKYSWLNSSFHQPTNHTCLLPPPSSIPIRLQGYNEFSLLSLSCSDYLSLPSVGIQIKNRLKDENIALSLPSQVGAVCTNQKPTAVTADAACPAGS